VSRLTPSRAIRCAILAGAAVSCADEPPPIEATTPGYPNAYPMTDCAPWDGIATSIYVSAGPLERAVTPGSEVPRPHVWISVYVAAPDLTGTTTTIDNERQASGALCPADGACVTASSGWIRIRETSADRSLVGEFELEFFDPSELADTISTLSGGFRAAWHERSILCG
jgi:hypothetical protein